MKLTQIRNATLKVEYAGKKFLIDPMLSKKGAFPGFPGTINSHIANPTVDLPLPLSEILDVDAVIVTHTHQDHWDDAAKEAIPKDMPIFTQNARDQWDIQMSWFRNTWVLEERNNFGGITLNKTPGQHGRGEILEGLMGDILGNVCGIVFTHPREKTLYIAGDTVWYQGVEQNLKQYKPDVMVLNSGDAKVLPNESIIMGKEDVYEAYKAAPLATIIASHMGAVNHASLSREDLRAFIVDHRMNSRVLVPEDGESYSF
jgi:L-ascorbate metabolism protein UlaG (beta-lactamase superfamily)